MGDGMNRQALEKTDDLQQGIGIADFRKTNDAQVMYLQDDTKEGGIPLL